MSTTTIAITDEQRVALDDAAVELFETDRVPVRSVIDRLLVDHPDLTDIEFEPSTTEA